MSNGKGRGWHGDIERHREAGRRGGEKTSSDREHMSEIGKKGGAVTSADREHMSRIGRKGGLNKRKNFSSFPMRAAETTLQSVETLRVNKEE